MSNNDPGDGREKPSIITSAGRHESQRLIGFGAGTGRGGGSGRGVIGGRGGSVLIHGRSELTRRVSSGIDLTPFI